jgi:malonyl-CoA O-methyltransferase
MEEAMPRVLVVDDEPYARELLSEVLTAKGYAVLTASNGEEALGKLKEEDLATRLLRWLIHIQRKDGSFTSADGAPHVFDTGQVLRGLLSASNLMPEALEAATRAAKFLRSRLTDGGGHGFEIDTVWVRRYSKSIPLSSHLYVLPPLLRAAELFHNPEWKLAVRNALVHYVKSNDGMKLSTLTHFLAYELEALIDLGEGGLALPILNGLRESQATDGAVRGLPGVTWVCTPGLAQLAVSWYKIGQREPADRAMNWLERHQTLSGGFRGSYGENASYFPDVEISWAAKFYLDASLLRDSIRENQGSP